MSIVLDAAIGLALVFLLVSLLASALQEAFSNALNSRGKLLENAIAQLLNGELLKHDGIRAKIRDMFRVKAHLAADGSPLKDTLAGQVLGHGLLNGLFKGERLPSYIRSEMFADALIDCLRRRAREDTPTQTGLLWAVRNLEGHKASYALETIVIAAGTNIADVRKQIVDLYEATMDRVSGWYSRMVRWRTFAFGLAIAVCFQVDAMHITQTLMDSESLRSSLVTAAQAQSKAGLPEGVNVAQATNRLTSLGLPIGWSACAISDVKLADEAGKPAACDASQWSLSKIALMVVGWLVVALAVTQGAPFWFDLINRFIAARGAGPKPVTQSADVPAKAAPGAKPLWTSLSADENVVPPGMTSDDVINVQSQLGVPQTAVVDLETRNAVRRFQKLIRVAATGALDAAIAREILRPKR